MEIAVEIVVGIAAPTSIRSGASPLWARSGECSAGALALKGLGPASVPLRSLDPVDDGGAGSVQVTVNLHPVAPLVIGGQGRNGLVEHKVGA